MKKDTKKNINVILTLTFIAFTIFGVGYFSNHSNKHLEEEIKSQLANLSNDIQVLNCDVKDEDCYSEWIKDYTGPKSLHDTKVRLWKLEHFLNIEFRSSGGCFATSSDYINK